MKDWGTGVRERPDGREIVRLWSGLLGPPVIWLAALSANYALTGVACAGERAWILDLVNIAAMLLVGLTTFIAWRSWREIGGGDAGETVEGRRRLMALGGMANGAFFAIVILATAVPTFVLRSCP